MARITYYCNCCDFSIDHYSSMIHHMCSDHKVDVVTARSIITNLKENWYSNFQDKIHPMFLDNNYTKEYYDIIKQSRKEKYDCYTETHHIIPRSLNGSDDPENLVVLTAKNHFKCHYLLVHMVEKDTSQYFKMIKAFSCMRQGQNRFIDETLYQELKTEMSKTFSHETTGSKNSQYNTIWMSNIQKRLVVKVKKTEELTMLDEGWIRGRILNFDLFNLDGSKKPVVKTKKIRRLTRLETLRRDQGLITDIEPIKDISILLNLGSGLHKSGFNYLAVDLEEEIRSYLNVISRRLSCYGYSRVQTAKSLSINPRTLDSIIDHFKIPAMPRDQWVKEQKNILVYKTFDAYRSGSGFSFNIHSEPKVVDYHLVKDINSDKLKDSGVYRSKLYSIKDGFDNSVPIEVISHPANCIYTRRRNLTRDNSLISYEELIRRISLWETAESIELILAPGQSKYKTQVKSTLPDQLTCPHCGKSGYKTAMKRWHFDNCREK